VNEPLDLEYQTEAGEERFKSLGSTLKGRVLVALFGWSELDAYGQSLHTRRLNLTELSF
jgi:hypothetical protein